MKMSDVKMQSQEAIRADHSASNNENEEESIGDEDDDSCDDDDENENDDDDDDMNKIEPVLGDNVISSSPSASTSALSMGGGENAKHVILKLGGPNGSNGVPAYALLVGMFLMDGAKNRDANDNEHDHPTHSNPTATSRGDIITIPITRLPVTLGKDHATKDSSFIGLKEHNSNQHHDASSLSADQSDINAPKLSQSMCCIFYRDAHGGKLGLYKRGRKKETSSSNNAEGGDKSVTGDNSVSVGGCDHDDPFGGMIYKPYHEQQQQHDNDEAVASPDDIMRLPGMDANASLPKSGFFAIECTGRKITVDKKVLRKGQCAMLQNGTTIQIAAYHFYFLLPNNVSNKAPTTMRVGIMTTAPVLAPAIKIEQIQSSSTASIGKINTSEAHNQNDQNDDDSTILSPTPKKARTSAAEEEEEEELHPSSSPSPALFNDTQSDIELLRMLSERVLESTSWDHESQKLGSTLAVRACRAAAKSKTIQRVAREKGGVTQRDLIDWMNDRDGDSVFVEFEPMMLTKITKKSLMMSIGKAILRAGYERNELITGRAFRWNLPKDVSVSVDSSPSLVITRHSKMSVEEEDCELSLDNGRMGMDLKEEENDDGT